MRECEAIPAIIPGSPDFGTGDGVRSHSRNHLRFPGLESEDGCEAIPGIISGFPDSDRSRSAKHISRAGSPRGGSSGPSPGFIPGMKPGDGVRSTFRTSGVGVRSTLPESSPASRIVCGASSCASVVSLVKFCPVQFSSCFPQSEQFRDSQGTQPIHPTQG